MALETTLNNVEDRIIPSLSYILPSGAKYITNKRSVKYYASGSNIYKPRNGTKVIRILLSGDDFLDPSTVRVSFDLKNNTVGGLLAAGGGAWMFFRRVRLMAGSTTIEDIDYYNRSHEMFHRCLPKDVKETESSESLGFDLDIAEWQRNPYYTQTNKPNGGSIEGLRFRTVTFKPLLGLLNQEKMIPLMFAPLTLELELVDDLLDPLIETVPLAVGNTHDKNGLSEDQSTVPKQLSTDWSIENPVVNADVITLDNQLNNEYYNQVLSGKSIPITFSTIITQMQNLTSGNTGSKNAMINITRAVSRLKSVFVTFSKTTDQNGARVVHNGARQNTATTVENKLYENNNTFFYGPHTVTGGTGSYSSDHECHAQIQIGSKKLPENEIRSSSEAYYQLRKCLGVHGSSNHSLGIDAFRYLFDSYILGVDCEKSMEANGTGLNLKNGELISVKYNFTTNNSAEYPKEMYITLHHDAIIEISSTGVQVYD